MALLEPAARGVSGSEQVAAALAPVIGAYRSGDRAGAVDGFLRHVCGEDYRAALDRAVSLGGTVVTPVQVIPGMVTLAVFADPEGNQVGIVADEPPPAQ